MNNLGDALRGVMKDLSLNEENIQTKEMKELQESIDKQIQVGNAESNESGDERKIFSQYISYENAESIMKHFEESSRLTILNIDSFKEKLIDICKNIIAQDQSPVEILVYATKSSNFSTFVENALLDVLKEVSNYDVNLIKAYDNILRKWTWYEQVSLVIKSCIILRLEEMGDNLIHIVEKNDMLRADAARAIIALDLDKYYNRVVNIFTAIKNDTREVGDICKEIFSKVVREEKGKNSLLRAYFESSNKGLSGIFLSTLNKYVTNKDFEYITQFIKGNDKYAKRKAIHLLGRIRNKYSVELLKRMKDDPQIDKKEYVIALGYTNDISVMDILIEYIENSKEIDVKSAALIALGNLRDNRVIDYIVQCFNKAVDKGDIYTEIAASSVLVQLGQKDKIKNIFKYIVTPNIEHDYVNFARNQLRRVRGLNKFDINSSLDQVSEKALEKIQDEERMFNIIYMLTNGYSELSNKIMLDTLKSTSSDRIKTFILEYFTKNFNRLNDTLKEEVRKSFVNCSNSNSFDVKDTAMKGLRIMNRREDSTPIANY